MIMALIPCYVVGLVDYQDILASAPTGSGKTAAFVIPTLLRLQGPKKKASSDGDDKKEKI